MSNREDAVLRTDFVSFVVQVFHTVWPGDKYFHNWHIEAICHVLMQCKNGTTNRLLITVPPRHLKSLCVSIAYVAWYLGYDPRAKFIVVSYSNDLAVELTRQFRLVVNAEWYRRIFPGTRAAKETENEYITTAGGYRYATSVAGTLLGRGADTIILDDPMKLEEAVSKNLREGVINWLRGTLFTRLNNKKEGVIINVMQRLHVEDLAGQLIAQGSCYHLNLPVIAKADVDIPIGPGEVHHRKAGDLLHPEREPQEVLDGIIKPDLGEANFAAQYLQEPVPEKGMLIDPTRFRRYQVLPPREGGRVLQSWDTALKDNDDNDPTVCITALQCGEDIFLMDLVQKRVNYPDLKRLVINLHDRFRPDVVLIEDKGSGTSLIQDLKRENKLWPSAVDPKLSKRMRMELQLGKVESGHVYLPEAAPWLTEFLDEIAAFPRGRHDDQVDSMSQLLHWITDNQYSTFRYDMGWDDHPILAWRRHLPGWESEI